MDNSEAILTSYLDWCNGHIQEVADHQDFLRFAKFINWTAEHGYYLSNIDKVSLHSELERRSKVIFIDNKKTIQLLNNR